MGAPDSPNGLRWFQLSVDLICLALFSLDHRQFQDMQQELKEPHDKPREAVQKRGG